MLPLTGYCDPLSAPPGGRIAVKVSSLGGAAYDADLVRIVHADPNPAGPGLRYEPVAAAFAGRYPGHAQPVHRGSHGVIAPAPVLSGPFTVGATVWPTRPEAGWQAVLASLADGRGFALEIGPEGARVILAGGEPLAVGKPLRAHAWYRIRARWDGRRLSVAQAPLAPAYAVDDAGLANRAQGDGPPGASGPLVIAARPGNPPSHHFNGKIEAPFVVARAIPEGTVPSRRTRGLAALWDFGRAIGTPRLVDLGPNRHHGRLVNLPTRGVTGSTWRGREHCWRHAPADYAAIHFHDDDLEDCGWETDFTVAVPPDMPSGVYGVRLRTGGVEEIIPFYVRPATGAPTARLCFLAPTFTYQAYGNHARDNFDDAFRARVAAWGARPWNPDDHPEYGLSTYNVHSDGSGIAYASRRRPILTMRPGFLTFDEPRGSGLRHFPADSHLTDWLAAKGHAFDVITDEDLDDEGLDLIAPYQCVITGSHPEYHTPGTWDALAAYTAQGGRLVYLGGNGFYWRIARSPEYPGVIEIRRAEGGIRAWAAEPGEYYHAFDGGLGGLWRRNGRPPQRLVGVGFSAQGLFEAGYYRRTAAAADPRVSWLFAGIEDEIIGDFGLNGGGAAGFELDRADPALGTPAHALVVATSEHHGPTFVLVHEEWLTHVTTLSGEPPERLIRADMTFFETPAGGAVFSTGAITFAGSLSHNGYDNPVSRLLDNVLRRFTAD